MVEVVNARLRTTVRAGQEALASAVASSAKLKGQLRHLGAKLFAERRAYRAGVEAALAEMRLVVRQNEELAVLLGLMTKRAAIADALLGNDASGSALSTTLEYAADLLVKADAGEGLFTALLRAKALEVRTLAAYPCGPAPQGEVPDVSSEPDGATPAGGQVYRIALEKAGEVPRA